MTITPIDPAQIPVLVAASVAITQIFKDMGVEGQWLKVVCIAVSTLLGTILIFAPDLWVALVAPLVGAIGTGGVSFVKDLRSHGSRPSGG